MDISMLRYFLTVASTQNMTAAAQELHISQPALSNSIRRLEAEIGFLLFDRVGRSIQLNEYGKVFYESAKTAVDVMDRADLKMHAIKRASAEHIRLVIPDSASSSLMVDGLIAKFGNLSVYSIGTFRNVDLENKAFDFFIAYNEINRPRLSSTILRDDRFVVCCSKQHPLASKDRITVDDLSSFPFASTHSEFSPENTHAEQLKQLGLNPHVTFRGNSVFDKLKAISLGGYLSLLVESFFNEHKTEDMMILPVENMDIPLQCYLYWHTDDEVNPKYEEFRKYIIDYYKNNS